MTSKSPIPAPEPCECCGDPIVWGLNETCTVELKFKEGRALGGYILLWRPSLKSWQVGGYVRLDGVCSQGGFTRGELPRLVYPRHECRAAAKKAWKGDPSAMDPWRRPSFKVPPRLDTVDGLPDPF